MLLSVLLRRTPIRLNDKEMIIIKTQRRRCSRNKQKVTDDEKMVRLQINVREYRMGQSKKDIPEKQATSGTQDGEKHRENTT